MRYDNITMISKMQAEKIMEELKQKLDEKGLKCEYRYEGGEFYMIISLKKMEQEIRDIFRKHNINRVRVVIDKGYMIIRV